MNFQWAVIGAGPAGIAAVGKLIDNGIPSDAIAWIDPQFNVGDFGTRWSNVPSNTKVNLFLKFLSASSAFDYKNAPANFAINHAEINHTCHLSLMAEPLQWITQQLKQKVHSIKDSAEKLSLSDRTWQIELKNSKLSATNIILATGADAQSLAFPTPDIIPLHDAMDAERIKLHCKPDDTIGVFGSSHSAILALRNLVEGGHVKQIINFYRSPLQYAVYLDDWILFDDSGLKGSAAEWARNYIDGKLPANLTRYYSNEENIAEHLPQCNKVVYAIGFKRRNLPVVEGMGKVDYKEQSGIIAPGLFGLGIAFPEAKYDRLGTLEYRVGLWKFMDYLQRIMPVWLKYAP